MKRTSESVKCIKTLVRAENARVAEFEMEPDSKGEVHYHSEVIERCICTKGQLQVVIDGHTSHSLNPGGSVEIPAGVGHQVINLGSLVCRYVVVQYDGAYDFIVEGMAP